MAQVGFLNAVGSEIWIRAAQKANARIACDPGTRVTINRQPPFWLASAHAQIRPLKRSAGRSPPRTTALGLRFSDATLGNGGRIVIVSMNETYRLLSACVLLATD